MMVHRDPRRLRRLLALRQAEVRKAERSLAAAVAAARSASEGEARVMRALLAAAPPAGKAEPRDLLARAAMSALLEPALNHARIRAAAGKAGIEAALRAVGATQVARDTVEHRLSAAQRARLEAAEERMSSELPARRRIGR